MTRRTSRAAEVAPSGATSANAPFPTRPLRWGGLVAIVGRPNVGKSTLFNRLVGRPTAIVHDEPGVTRDRHYGEVTALGRRYSLVDTGGFDPLDTDPLRASIKKQIEAAVEEADVVICVLDALAPATSLDHAELALLRKAQKPVVYVANKADSPKADAEAADLYRLGIEHVLPVSAQHGRGVGELLAAIDARLPPASAEPPPAEAEGAIRVAIVGRPNAGKSSLVNHLLGEERMIVDDKPGTTRDSVDSLVERGGHKLVVVDTAGIRRKAKVEKAGDVVESVSVMQAIRAMERADVVLLLADASDGVSEQDAKILGLAVERGRGIVIGLNKMDLCEKKSLDKAIADARDKLAFAPWADIVTLSAKTGRHVGELLRTVAVVAESFARRVSTGELNRFFEQVLAHRPPPTQGGKAPRLYFITQAESSPPLFVVMASDPEKIHFSYQRYVQNQIRKAFDFRGVPVRVKYKAKRRRER